MARRLFFGRIRYTTLAIIAAFALQIAVKDLKYLVPDADANAAATGQDMGSDDGPLARPSYVSLLSYPADHYPPLQPYYTFAAALQIRWEIERLARAAHPLKDVRHVEQAVGGPKTSRTYVVVIGESLSRYHMHLYGYGRDTTPQLDRLAESGELLVFRDVVTSHALTVPALLSALRFAPGDHHGQTLFDVFNGGGFKTYWISNQHQAGPFESAVSLLTASVPERIWLNYPGAGRYDARMNGRYEERHNFDDNVLGPLRKIVKRDEGDKIVFIHLLGNHFFYRARFPEARTYFNGAGPSACRTTDQNQLIDDYDNSVRFNDDLVSQIIAVLRGINEESFVLYFSDHGEEIYDWRDYFEHDDTMMSPYLAQVPFVVWLSDTYRRAHPAFAEEIANATGRPFVTSDLIPTVTDLARLSFPGIDETRSLFSDKFVPHRRIAASEDYDEFKAGWRPDRAHSKGRGLISCADSADNGWRPR